MKYYEPNKNKGLFKKTIRRKELAILNIIKRPSFIQTLMNILSLKEYSMVSSILMIKAKSLSKKVQCLQAYSSFIFFFGFI